MSVAATEALLDELDREGVELWIEADQLRYRAPAGVLTAARKSAVSASKETLLEILRVRAAAAEPSPCVPGAECVWAPTEMQVGLLQRVLTAPLLAPMQLREPLVPAAFDTALEALLQRHAILRSRYIRGQSGAVWAVTDPHVAVPVVTQDYRALPPAEREMAARRANRDIASQPFDIERGPLLRVAVHRLDDAVTWVVFIVHHALFDAASQRILLTDFMALYAAAARSEQANLTPLPIQYSDFACEQRAMLDGVRGRETRQYWRDKLAGAREIFWLPYDRDVPVAESGTLAEAHVETDAAVVARLRQLAPQYECSLSVVVTAAFYALLVRWTARGDVASWVCRVGRDRPELQRLVGCFASFWPLRVDLSGDPSFVELLQRVNAAYVEGLRHAHVTVARLKPELDRVREGRYFPGIFFNFVPAELVPRTVGPQRSPSNDAGAQEVNGGFQLALKATATETDNGLHWVFQHANAHFEHATVGHACECLRQALTAIAQDPGARLTSFMPPVARER
jgi:hypothetical protein